MNKIPDRIDSKFRYVLLSAARAEQMIQGSSVQTDSKGPKVTRIAMDEITSDAIEWDYGPAPEPVAEDAEVESEAAETADSDKA